MCRPFCLVLALALVPSLSAQQIERSHVALPVVETQPREPHVTHQHAAVVIRTDTLRPRSGPMILSGIAFGTIGMFAGGYLGYHAEVGAGCGDQMFCGLGGAILGGLLGEAFGMASGIHAAGGRRHSFAGDFGTALGISALGLVAAPVTAGASLLAVPVVQVIAGVSREGRSPR